MSCHKLNKKYHVLPPHWQTIIWLSDIRNFLFMNCCPENDYVIISINLLHVKTQKLLKVVHKSWKQNVGEKHLRVVGYLKDIKSKMKFWSNTDKVGLSNRITQCFLSWCLHQTVTWRRMQAIHALLTQRIVKGRVNCLTAFNRRVGWADCNKSYTKHKRQRRPVGCNGSEQHFSSLSALLWLRDDIGGC